MDLKREPFCRPMCRLLLKQTGEDGALYLGVTPDGRNPGRLGLSRILVLQRGGEQNFTVKAGNGCVRLEAGAGWAEFAIALPNRLLIRGRDLTLLFGNGLGAGVFMGGGSAVQDAYNPGGAMMAMSGTKLRFLPKKGTVDVSSAWDLNTLTDPDPRVYLRPDEDGALDFVVYESDFDEHCVEDGLTFDEAAAQTEREFEAFLASIKLPGEEPVFLRAAYAIWTSLQPDRALADKRMLAPEYIAGRDAEGTAYQTDNVLLSLLFREREAALARLGSFLKYARPDGLIPCEVSNRSQLLEATLPLFGFALRELAEGAPVPGELYAGLKKALGWWKNERFCAERGLYYYLHRYEPACSGKLPFADEPPEFAPDLNALLLLWLDAMAVLADGLGLAEEKAAWKAEAEALGAALLARLWDGERFVFLDIHDKPVCAGHPRALLPALLDTLPEAVLAAVRAAIPAEAGEDALFLAYALRGNGEEKLRAIAAQLKAEAASGSMTVRRALTLLLVCGACA